MIFTVVWESWRGNQRKVSTANFSDEGAAKRFMEGILKSPDVISAEIRKQ